MNSRTDGAAPATVPAKADPTGRTPHDYDIEHAEYMAKAAERFQAAANELDAASGEFHAGNADPRYCRAIGATEAYGEAFSALTSAIYEFRKRRDRAILAAQAAIPQPATVDDLKPDWSELDAARKSLREHMRMAKVLLTQLKDLRAAAARIMPDSPEIRAADAVIAHYDSTAASGVPAAPEGQIRELIEDLCSAAVSYGERDTKDAENAYYAAKAKLIGATRGVPPTPAPDTRKPWEKSSWTCVQARVDHEGLHCPPPGQRCPDCPSGVEPSRGGEHG